MAKTSKAPKTSKAVTKEAPSTAIGKAKAGERPPVGKARPTTKETDYTSPTPVDRPKPPPGYQSMGPWLDTLWDAIQPNSPQAVYRRGLKGTPEGGASPERPVPPDYIGAGEDVRAEIKEPSLREAQDTYAAQQGTQQRSLDLSAQSQTFTEEERKRRDRAEAGISQDAVTNDYQLAIQQKAAAGLPGEAEAAMGRISADFESKVAGATGEVKSWATQALTDVSVGQSAAMTAAVQGFQNQVNDQVSQIQANPDIPDAQKQQMISQVKMQGAMAIMPAVGQTITKFQEIRAGINNQTISSIGSILSAVTSARGALASTQSNVMGQAHIASKELGLKIAEDRVANRQWAVAARQVNDAARLAAEQFNETTQLALLPTSQDPVLYTSQVFVNDGAMRMHFMDKQFQADLNLYGIDKLSQMLAIQTRSDMAMLPFQMFAQGGLPGMALGLAGSNFMGGQS